LITTVDFFYEIMSDKKISTKKEPSFPKE